LRLISSFSPPPGPGPPPSAPAIPAPKFRRRLAWSPPLGPRRAAFFFPPSFLFQIASAAPFATGPSRGCHFQLFGELGRCGSWLSGPPLLPPAVLAAEAVFFFASAQEPRFLRQGRPPPPPDSSSLRKGFFLYGRPPSPPPPFPGFRLRTVGLLCRPRDEVVLPDLEFPFPLMVRVPGRLTSLLYAGPLGRTRGGFSWPLLS